MDFSAEDRINFNLYNHILWKGLMGDQPYPEKRTGKSQETYGRLAEQSISVRRPRRAPRKKGA